MTVHSAELAAILRLLSKLPERDKREFKTFLLALHEKDKAERAGAMQNT